LHPVCIRSRDGESTFAGVFGHRMRRWILGVLGKKSRVGQTFLRPLRSLHQGAQEYIFPLHIWRWDKLRIKRLFRSTIQRSLRIMFMYNIIQFRYLFIHDPSHPKCTLCSASSPPLPRPLTPRHSKRDHRSHPQILLQAYFDLWRHVWL